MNNDIEFNISIIEVLSHTIIFKVEKVIGWIENEPDEFEHFLTGNVKYDGCMNLNFESCIHFCTENEINSLSELLQLLRKIASQQLKNWDPE